MLHTQLAALVLAATTIAASGCGGSSKAEASNTPTRAEFIAKADAICRALGAKISSLTLNTQRDFQRALPKVEVWSHSESEELNMLTPAAPIEYEWRKFLVGTRIYTEQFAALANYAKSHKVSNSSSLFSKTLVTHHHTNEIAKRIGFKDCSSQT